MLDQPLTFETLAPLLAGAFALLFSYVVFQRGGKRLLGPEFSFWNPLRRAIIPLIDKHLSKYGGYAETNVFEEEYVGTVYGVNQMELDRWHAEEGAMRYPLASIASVWPDGRTETASWAFHEHPWSKRQLHSRTFDAHPDRQRGDSMQAFDIYAHNEYSAHNPFVAIKHYRGVGLNKSLGVQQMRSKLEDSEFEWSVKPMVDDEDE